MVPARPYSEGIGRVAVTWSLPISRKTPPVIDESSLREYANLGEIKALRSSRFQIQRPARLQSGCNWYDAWTAVSSRPRTCNSPRLKIRNERKP